MAHRRIAGLLVVVAGLAYLAAWTVTSLWLWDGVPVRAEGAVVGAVVAAVPAVRGLPWALAPMVLRDRRA